MYVTFCLLKVWHTQSFVPSEGLNGPGPLYQFSDWFNFGGSSGLPTISSTFFFLGKNFFKYINVLYINTHTHILNLLRTACSFTLHRAGFATAFLSFLFRGLIFPSKELSHSNCLPNTATLKPFTKSVCFLCFHMCEGRGLPSPWPLLQAPPIIAKEVWWSKGLKIYKYSILISSEKDKKTVFWKDGYQDYIGSLVWILQPFL